METASLESVAQAIAKASGVSDWKHVSEHGEYDSRDYWRRLARAAIDSIREPVGPLLDHIHGCSTVHDWRRSVDIVLGEDERSEYEALPLRALRTSP